MHADCSFPSLDELLAGFIAGDKHCRTLFPMEAERYLLKVARQRAPDLPPDIQEEIVQQTLLLLLQSPASSFDPTRGSAGAYLGLAVQTAARQVRASYAPPGAPTRRRAKGEAPRATVSLDEVEAEQMPSVEPMQQVDAQLDASTLLAQAPANVALALVQLHVLDMPIKQVAKGLKLSRFALARRLTAFEDEVRAAA